MLRVGDSARAAWDTFKMNCILLISVKQYLNHYRYSIKEMKTGFSHLVCFIQVCETLEEQVTQAGQGWEVPQFFLCKCS